MSYHPQPITPVPDETSRIARAVFPTGTLAMALREDLADLYTDEDFVDRFAARGQAAACPWRLAVVTILQFLAGLTDRQAADAVRSRIDWKYLLGLAITDTGCHFTVLHAFRTRLIAGRAELRLLTIMLERLQRDGLLKARGRQHTSSAPGFHMLLVAVAGVLSSSDATIALIGENPCVRARRFLPPAGEAYVGEVMRRRVPSCVQGGGDDMRAPTDKVSGSGDER